MGPDDREGNATPAWLANDFNASRRHALLVAQVIKRGEKLSDSAVTTFIKLIGRLFSRANSRKKRRHIDSRTVASKALRLFLDTISALESANDHGQDAEIEGVLHDLENAARVWCILREYPRQNWGIGGYAFPPSGSANREIKISDEDYVR